MLSVDDIEFTIELLEFSKRKMAHKNSFGHNNWKVKKIDNIIYELVLMENEMRRQYERV